MSEMEMRRRYPAVPSAITSRRVGAETVVLNLDSGMYFTLNEVGAFVWDQIDGRRSLQDILDRVLAEYEVDEPTARADIAQIVEELLKEGAIELRDGPAGST